MGQASIPMEVIKEQAMQAEYYLQHSKHYSQSIWERADKKERVVYANEAMLPSSHSGLYGLLNHDYPRRTISNITLFSEKEKRDFADIYQK